jgi:hypothetical protein
VITWELGKGVDTHHPGNTSPTEPPRAKQRETCHDVKIIFDMTTVVANNET